MQHAHYLPERMGSAILLPAGSFEAGSFQSFTLVYTAGYFGIDDTAILAHLLGLLADFALPGRLVGVQGLLVLFHAAPPLLFA